MLGIIIFGLRVFIHVKAGITAYSRHEGLVVRVGQPLEIKYTHTFTVMEPIQTHWEFLVEHAITCQFHFNRFSFGVLKQVPFPS